MQIPSESTSLLSLSFGQGLARRIIISVLSNIKHGGLTISESFGESLFFGSQESPLQAEFIVTNPKFYQRLLTGGSIAAAESYIDGDWQSNNLTQLVQLMAHNLDRLDQLESRFYWLVRPINQFIHWLHRNHPEQAKKNIAAHYDLGNDFYQAFLDKNMLYSSALFLHEQNTLEQAQIDKMHRLCEQLVLTPEDHLLEIGSGWGALAEYAAREYGCKVTTTTISKEQYQYTCQRIQNAGLSDRVTILFEDYRHLNGQFDKIVSVEMIEAVGKKYLPVYIEQCLSLLKPQGRLVIQAITIADERYKSYSRKVDFIQRYIFPGGFLPSLEVLENILTEKSFIIDDIFDIGIDYAKTLAIWHQRFVNDWPMLKEQGFNSRFKRLWLFYLCYCEGGFRAKTISTVQLTAIKP